MTENEKFKAYILKVREKGFLRHCLESAILYGPMMYVVTGLVDLSEKSFNEAFFSSRALLSGLIFLAIAGLILGPFMWWGYNRSLKKIEESEKARKSS